jgi:hypothetical protein
MFPTSTPLVPDDRYYEHEPTSRDLDEARSFGRQTAYRQHTIERPSPGKRIVKSIVRLFAALLIGAGLTLTWQSHGEEAKEFLGAWAPSLTWLLPPAAPKKPDEVVNSPELMQQMKLLAVDVAIVRRNVGQIATNQEQLAVKQDQMGKSIGTVQELAQEIREQAISIPAPKAQPRQQSLPQTIPHSSQSVPR